MGKICEPCECSKARARKADLEDAVHKADFSDAAYAAENGKSPETIQGYRNISNDPVALKKHGLKPEDLKIPGTNFTAVVYEKGDQAVVAYKGTTSWLGSDMAANAKQALDIRDGNAPTEYYNRAQEIARKMAAQSRERGTPMPEFVGHSLGGGLASAAAQAVGAPATIFNPAGLNPGTVTGPMSGAPVTAVKVAGEIVSGAVNKLPGLPDAYSTRDLMLDPPLSFGRDILMKGVGALIGAGMGGPWGSLGGLAAAKLIRSGLLHMMSNVRDALSNEIKKADRAIAKYCG